MGVLAGELPCGRACGPIMSVYLFEWAGEQRSWYENGWISKLAGVCVGGQAGVLAYSRMAVERAIGMDGWTRVLLDEQAGEQVAG